MHTCGSLHRRGISCEESAQSQYCMNLVEPIRTLTVDWAVGTAKFSINVDKPGMGLTKKVAG